MHRYARVHKPGFGGGPTSWRLFMRRTLVTPILVVIALLAVALLTGFTTKTNAKPPIIIGFATAHSGFIQPFDGPATIAAQIARDEINTAGGILGGRRIKFV